MSMGRVFAMGTGVSADSAILAQRLQHLSRYWHGVLVEHTEQDVWLGIDCRDSELQIRVAALQRGTLAPDHEAVDGVVIPGRQ